MGWFPPPRNLFLQGRSPYPTPKGKGRKIIGSKVVWEGIYKHLSTKHSDTKNGWYLTGNTSSKTHHLLGIHSFHFHWGVTEDVNLLLLWSFPAQVNWLNRQGDLVYFQSDQFDPGYLRFFKYKNVMTRGNRHRPYVSMSWFMLAKAFSRSRVWSYNPNLWNLNYVCEETSSRPPIRYFSVWWSSLSFCSLAVNCFRSSKASLASSLWMKMPLKCWAHCQKIVPWSGDPSPPPKQMNTYFWTS